MVFAEIHVPIRADGSWSFDENEALYLFFKKLDIKRNDVSKKFRLLHKSSHILQMKEAKAIRFQLRSIKSVSLKFFL